MTQQQSPEPGWYVNDAGKTQWWDGASWADKKTEKEVKAWQKAQIKEKYGNAKLATIGHFAWILAVVGVLALVFSWVDFVLAGIGAWCVGAAITLWIIWLAFGAIVDEIRKPR
ncbi:hypothetical protein [Leucobacter chinensis]|uniref:hypothetical protein n=1 Tax=Leucobacter chinensis TaxID=2851010 RepID=UPI001C22F7A7|nr:hypothetical protein [Leucobacter chinensis]